MRCPACGSPATKQQVHKTVDVVDENKRWRRCECGARWTTAEKMIRGTLQVICDPLIAKHQVTGDPQVTERQVISDPSVTLRGRGVNPDLGLFLIGSGSLEASGSEVVRKIGNGNADAAYPAEFEAIWAHTGRRGLKARAFTAWKKHGKPTMVQVEPKWAAYMLSDRPSRGYVFDLSTWLNGRGWLQEWQPYANAIPGAAGSATDPSRKPFAGYCNDHLDGNPRRFARKFDPNCPPCRELKAKYAGRHTTEDELFAKG